MTLHKAVVDAFATRRDEIVADLANTRAAITRVRAELERALDVEHRLEADLGAIIDAWQLLAKIDTEQEGT